MEYLLMSVVLLLAAVYGVTQVFQPIAKRRMDQAGGIMSNASNKLDDFANTNAKP